ncbi:MAG: TIGR01777 family protein [Bacteroidales bacterium]|nr:TIGR01777 family protein [Bacteroidales bacterium]
MKIAISGAGGFLGTSISRYFQSLGHTVMPISRAMQNLRDEKLASLLEGADVIINLAGAAVVSRWSDKNKQLIYDSRILTTRKLVAATKIMKSPPSVLVSASAIGIYQSHGEHNETSHSFDDGFLGKVCIDWEAEACKATCRVVIMRTGIVLGREGGALPAMLLPFKLGLGGPIASGKQGFSWIHVNDLIRAVDFLIHHTELSGIFNFTAPNPVDNLKFSKALASVLHRPAFFHTPAFVLRLLYGEGATALTQGQFVYPDKLINSGFSFQYPALESALHSLFRKGS